MPKPATTGSRLTLDIHHLDPFDPDFLLNTRHLAARLRALSLGCVVETGARFLLNPRAKHEPTLISADPDGRALRLDFLTRALTVVAETGGEAMSFWAGVPKPGVARADALGWLAEGVSEVVARAAAMGVVAALEPEPGMLVETVDDWRSLGVARTQIGAGHRSLPGHPGEREPAAAVREFADALGTVTDRGHEAGQPHPPAFRRGRHGRAGRAGRVGGDRLHQANILRRRISSPLPIRW